MKIEMTMYSLECDLCKTPFRDDHNGFVGWTHFDGALESAMDSGWIEDKEGIKHYCPDCVEINDEDEVVNKKTGEVLFLNP